MVRMGWMDEAGGQAGGRLREAIDGSVLRGIHLYIWISIYNTVNARVVLYYRPRLLTIVTVL